MHKYINMYRIKIAETPKATVACEYNIGGNLVLLTRDDTNEITGVPEHVEIGITVDELLGISETIKDRIGEHAIDVEPPESDWKPKSNKGYCDRDDE